MKYAVIAAGEGSRLAAEGVAVPKPLVKVAGECLMDHLIRIFMENDAEEIVVICNEQMTPVAQHLLDIQRDGLQGRPVPLRFIVRSTPSSMHSLHAMSQYLTDAPFVLTTVDTIFREDEFKAYVRAFSQYEGDALMGVTTYIDDEKPLYVTVDAQQHITGFHDAPPLLRGEGRGEQFVLVSAGIYGLTPSVFNVLNGCISRGEKRMRNFQRALVSAGCRVQAWPFTKVLDIDHATDIQKAEAFVSGGCKLL